jgi:lipoprotein-releasing system permease protein
VTVTLISLVGLALGVLALVVTLALLEGFQATIRSELELRVAHVRVSPSAGRVLEGPEELVRVLQGELGDVETVEVVRGTCLVTSDTDAVPASLVGRSDTELAAVDRIIASRLGVGVGDRVQLVAPRSRLTPMGPLPIRLAVELERVRSPDPGSESGSVRVPLDVAQRLLWGTPAVEAIELRDPADPWRLAGRVRDALRDTFPGVRVQGLAELHRPLLLALALERAMIFIAVGLMLFVAALNLLCNVAMVAAGKRTDLAVLAGLGLGPRAQRRLFLLLGLGIGVIGSMAGAVAGTCLALLLEATEMLPLPRGVFAVSSVPFRVDPVTVATVVVVALLLATAAAWIPSRAVARREPAEGLRYE